jgi:aconitate hydratase
MLALTFADKADYDKVREDDRLSIVGINTFAPNQPLTAVAYHADGSEDFFLVNHTYNDLQIKWYQAGSALNYIKKNSI